MELNQKLINKAPQKTLQGIYMRKKNTYVRNWRLKKGGGICSKEAYFRELMIHTYINTIS